MKKYDGSSHIPIVFPHASSLGYDIHGLTLVGEFLKRTQGNLYIEADPRLIKLFQRSYDHPQVRFIPSDPDGRPPLPRNGKPETAEEMELYFSANAARLAKKLNLSRYAWSTLMRREMAFPFNVHAHDFVHKPKPFANYLYVDRDQLLMWQLAPNQPVGAPVLVSWNKTASQHSDPAQQNLSADDVVKIIKHMGNLTSTKMAFYNAVHGVGPDDLKVINAQLPKHLHMHMIMDPRTGGIFDLGKELDLYAAFMVFVKDAGGAMIGAGNTYQHLFYAAEAGIGPSRKDQLVTLPFGPHPVTSTWETAKSSRTLLTQARTKDNRPNFARQAAVKARRALAL